MKEGKVFKRVLAIALVVVMAMTMVPFGVFATGETTTTTPVCAHNTTHTVINRVEPTCTTDGHYRYYQCVCGEYFNVNTNGQLSAPITDPSTYGVIPNLGGHKWNETTGKCNVCQTSCIHTWNSGETTKAATCKEAGSKKFTCSVCGNIKTETIAQLTTHTWNDGETTKAATCKEAGTKKFTCNVCDGTKTETIAKLTTHTWENATCTAPKTCSVCNLTEGEALGHNATDIPAVAATCTVAGSKNGQKCSRCNHVIHEPEVVAALGHQIEELKSVAATCTTAGKTAGEKCTREGCDYVKAQEPIAARGHAWSTEKKVTLEATCTAKGSRATVCTREGCNAIKEGTVEEVAMKEHDYKAKAVTKEATCEAAGEKAKVCKNCTAKTDIEVINALGHQWDDGTIKVAADCQKEGTTTFKCKRTGCTKTEDRKVEKLDCKYKETVKEPTCEEDGYSTFTCEMCKSSYIDKKVDKFNHSFLTYVMDENTATCYSDGTKTAECDHGCGKKNTIVDEGSKIDHMLTDFKTIKEATCTEEGEEEAKCFYFDKCGYTESYPTDALGHTITKDTQYTVDKAATCEEKGSQSKHCERCSYTEGAVEIPALEHDYKLTDDSKATCTTAGVAKYQCTRCPKTKEETSDKPLGHNFDNYVLDAGTATCEKDGTETSKCKNCDVTDTRTAEGSKLAHTPGDAVVKPATLNDNGSSVKSCTACGNIVESFEITKIAALTLKYTKATYDGSKKIPKLTITDADGNALVKGTDYTVVVPSNEESAKIGTHTYTVTFMGNYEGEEEVSYKVLPGTSSKATAEKKQTSIKLTWKAVPGAVGYRVYVYNTSTKKYDIVAKYVKDGKTSYTVKNLKANTTYKFAIKAYGKNDEGTVIWAEESLKASFKTLVTKTSKLTATASKDSVKLTWSKVAGADGYRVYVYNTKTKKYSIVAKNVTGTTYTVKGLKAGTSYKYAVKAYDTVSNKTVWSNEYTTVKVTTKK